MVDGIKSDDMTASLSATHVSHTSAHKNAKTEGNSTNSTASNKGVIVTSHMSHLVNIMMGNNAQTSDEDARVQATKSQVQSNNYQVNVSALADKLMSTVLATNS